MLEGSTTQSTPDDRPVQLLGTLRPSNMISHHTAKHPSSQSAASAPDSPASSRSESMSSKSPATPDGIDFRFLNFSHPQEAKNAQTRRNVRSHVTTKQHERQRKRVAEQTKSRHSDASMTNALNPSVLDDQATLTGSPGISETDHSSPEGSAPTSPTSPLTRINPLEVYPELWHPYLRPVMDHYCNVMVIDLPETGGATRQAIRSHLLELVFTDPAPLHALMLVAAAHYAKVRGQNSHNIDMLALRGMAIQEVNRAMQDYGPQGRATSDRMIAAVCKMATFELLFGQRDTFHTHMTGLQRMVSLRGGLQALGLNGLLERILLWVDSNAAEITGGPLYFPTAAFASSYGHPQPDRRLFVGGLQSRAQ